MPDDTRWSRYWQAYPDLVDIVARGHWGAAELEAHWHAAGEAEGRRLGADTDMPSDWSDWLHFTDWQDEFAGWWRAGVLESGLWSALVRGGPGLEFGSIARNPRLRDLTGASPELRRQFVAHAHAWPGSGPLRDVAQGRLRWGTGEHGHGLALADLVAERFPGGVDQVLLMPWLQVGGAERVGVWHHEAAAAAGLSSVFLLADEGDIAPHYAHLAERTVNLTALFRETFGVEYRALPIEARIEAVIAALGALRPRLLHLIHSFVGYTALSRPRTAARARATAGRLHVSAFCPHIHPSGAQDGYFRFLPDLAPHTDLVIFDNSWFRDDIVRRFALPAERTAVLRYPVLRIEPVPGIADPACNRVLWASRLDAQKNPGVLARIAARLPQLEFLVYGREVLGDLALDWSRMPPNLRRCGPFLTPSELPLEEVFAFLYTSRFDGMPNILLEVGARGVPIVTPDIGGVADYLGHSWMFYAAGPDDVEGYATHLAALHRSPELRAFAAERLVALARRDRTFEAFRAAVRPLLPGPPDPGPASGSIREAAE